MIVFGPGVVTVTPLNVSNPPVYNIGLAQECSYEEAFTLKPIYGQNRRALAVGAGTIKATGKIKAARWSVSALSWLLYGVAPTAGQTTTAIAEAGTVPGVSTYTITVTNSATWTGDQGVVYKATAVPLKRVASVAAAGQYSVSAGVYTFFSADASAAVLITYNYTISATGAYMLGTNPVIGPTVSFGLNITAADPTNNGIGTLQVFNCVISKWMFGSKLEDFSMPDLEYEAYANAAGSAFQWNQPDVF